MKILHTSDWHLGHKLYNYDRKDEQLYFLRQIADIVKDEQPDVMIVSGDVFHVANPNIETQTMFVDELLNIHNQCNRMTTVVTAGNHDSYSRLEIDKSLWKRQNIHIIGNVSSSLEEHLININGKGIIAAVPFCSGRNYPQLSDIDSIDRQSLFFNELQKKAEEINHDNLPIVLSAHLAIKGCDIRGHKSETNQSGEEIIGGLEYSDRKVLGLSYDYIALGHIHHPQDIGDEHVRYCGTPMSITFNEEYEHSVTIVEIEKHGSPLTKRIIAIKELRPVRTLPLEDTPDPKGATVEDSLTLLERVKNEDVYVRLNVRIASGKSPAEANEKILRWLENNEHRCHFCLINPIRETSIANSIEDKTLSLNELIELSSEQIVEIANAAKDLTDKQKEMLANLIKQINQEQELL
ncbi:MAG: exonuclease SbcCD subunit D [Candidatus Limimorpha sp.]